MVDKQIIISNLFKFLKYVISFIKKIAKLLY